MSNGDGEGMKGNMEESEGVKIGREWYREKEEEREMHVKEKGEGKLRCAGVGLVARYPGWRGGGGRATWKRKGDMEKERERLLCREGKV